MSLDHLFDKMDRLEGRHLITMPCSFVKTARILIIYLPISFELVVKKYFPECTVEVVGDEIMVSKEAPSER